MKNKTVELASIVIGTYLGAGFVSGKEVVEYFAKYGFVSIFFAVFVGFLLCKFVNCCIIIGIKYKDCDNILNHIFKKSYPIVLLIIVINSIISVSAMIAGASSIGIVLDSKICQVILPLACIVLCFILLQFSHNGFAKLNKVLVPILLFLIVLIPLITCINSLGISIMLPLNILEVSVQGFVNSILYLFFNILTLGILLIQIGGLYTYKQAKRASVISSIIITSLIILISLSVILSNPNIILSDMPLLNEAKQLGVVMQYGFAVCQLLAVFTTLVSSVYIIINLFSRRVSKNKIILVSLIIGFTISLIGFSNIVKYLYKITGFVSILFFTLLFKELYFKKTKIYIKKITYH